MLFNSIEFFFFLPIVLIIYYALSQKYRWIFLLIASYVFYAGWKLNYIYLIILSTVIDNFIAIKIYETSSKTRKKLYLTISLIANFSMLLCFKYFHFLIGGTSFFKELASSSESILYLQYIFEFGIPAGISFYTFQTVSYTIDVYRGNTEPERNFFKFALFISYFPQLVAGPIERFSDLNKQLFNYFSLNKETIKKALILMLFGFFLKLCIGDNIGEIIDPVFSNPENYLISSKISSIFLFGLQIYTDFNGYTLIAIGVSHLFGIELRNNFLYPYSSISIREFWKRWHMTLSTWFRDYVYFPLGGKNNSHKKWILAIILTFGLSGLWHGAHIKFIYWGLIHGVFYILEQQFFPINPKKEYSKLNKSIRWLITMSIVFFAWLFFRINKLKDFSYFFRENVLHDNFNITPILLIMILFVVSMEFWAKGKRIDELITQKSLIIRWLIYCILLSIILFFGNTGSFQFIYFQF